jgi:diguanylate cyclase (GGDEF)-like protein
VYNLATTSAPSTKRALLVLSHAMERAFDSIETGGDSTEPGLVLGLFQRREYFEVELHRYAALAAAGHTVVVAFCGPTEGIPAGVHAVSLDEGDAGATRWVLLLLRGSYATSLVARDRLDLSKGEMTFQSSRQFDARATFRRHVALADARQYLSELAPELPRSVATAASLQIERSAALPVSDIENRLAIAADHLVTSLDSGQLQVNRLRSELEDSQFLAERDQLTGLHNRHYLERFLGGDDGPADLVVMLVDVDELKAVNDGHGHAAGDAVLSSVASILRGHSRPGDVVVRWGGDEFLLLMPGLSPEIGLKAGERLAEAVRRGHPPEPWDHLTLSVSIGVSFMRRTSLPLDRLDAALYDVKRSGKGHALLDPAYRLPPDPPLNQQP